MFGLPFGKKKQKDQSHFLTIDIGSQLVKCIAYKQDPETNKRVKLIGIGKEWVEPWSVRSGHIIEVEKVAKAIDSAIYKATENLTVEIDNVIFGVSGDASFNTITTAKNIRDDADKEINLKELKSLEEKILKEAFTKMQEMYSKRTGDTDTDLELITTAITYTKLNGEYVPSLEGETGSEIEMALYTSYTPKYYLKTLEDLASMLNLNILAITSNLYAIMEALKRSKNDQLLNGVIMDIGSDTTDVAVVFGGGMVASESLDFGGSQFTKHISMETGLNFVEAEKRKYDYTFDKLSEEDTDETSDLIGRATDLWLSGLEILFTNFEGVKTFAPDIYITGGASKVPLVTDYLESKPWTRAIPFKEPPNFVKLTNSDINFVTDTSELKDKEEFIIPLALSCIYLEITK